MKEHRELTNPGYSADGDVSNNTGKNPFPDSEYSNIGISIENHTNLDASRGLNVLLHKFDSHFTCASFSY